MPVIQLRPEPPKEDPLSGLLTIIHDTNMVGLDKCLWQIERNASYGLKAAWCSLLAERMIGACDEIKKVMGDK